MSKIKEQVELEENLEKVLALLGRMEDCVDRMTKELDRLNQESKNEIN